MTIKVPKHVAIIMDGNGRWAKQYYLPRVAGHRAGVTAVRRTIEFSIKHSIDVLSLFAFSSENWRRPQREVNYLLALLSRQLDREIQDIHANNIQLRVIGSRAELPKSLQDAVHNAETLTRQNTGLKLVLALNYGGQWDIVQACQKIAKQVATGQLSPANINAQVIQNHLALAGLPPPDLFIRTSGEQRLSNFFLWQLAYTELYFSACYWPDFDEAAFQQALDYYASRQRRFGRISEQVTQDVVV